MDLAKEASALIGGPEGETLEYKAVLPPPRNIAQLIAGFANVKGGALILGVIEDSNGLRVNGLSDDFRVNSVIHKALDLMDPKPFVEYGYFSYQNKRLYVIKVAQSKQTILVEGAPYIRTGNRTVVKDQKLKPVRRDTLIAVKEFLEKVVLMRHTSTGAKSKLLDHYQSVVNIVDDLGALLYPESPDKPTDNSEGQILTRILFSSCADNFETFLTDLLYEIFLAKPESLKNDEQVSIKDVLSCSDLQEFVVYWSKKKLSKLQRGSVKGFLVDTKQLNSLKVIDATRLDTIDKIFQIRHLYAHRNGVIDEKFLESFPGLFAINQRHELSINQMLAHLEFILDSADMLDKEAIRKFNLATL